jgi:hypothetical protein
LFDAPTKTSSLIGIIDRIFAPQYPIRFPRLFFFAEMTNGHDATEVEVRLVDGDEKIVLSQKAQINFPDVKNIVSVVLAFEGLAFNQPGEYYFQLFAAGQLVSSRRMICLIAQRPPVNPNGNTPNPNL